MAATKTHGGNMMLVNSAFRGAKSFSLIPVSLTSPYVEAMFDPSSGILAIITKDKKQSFHMMPRLDDFGNPQQVKFPREDGKTVKEQRVSVETFNEFYLSEKSDIEAFIKLFAVNEKDFGYQDFLNVDLEETKTSPILTAE